MLASILHCFSLYLTISALIPLSSLRFHIFSHFNLVISLSPHSRNLLISVVVSYYINFLLHSSTNCAFLCLFCTCNTHIYRLYQSKLLCVCTKKHWNKLNLSIWMAFHINGKWNLLRFLSSDWYFFHFHVLSVCFTDFIAHFYLMVKCGLYP